MSAVEHLLEWQEQPQELAQVNLEHPFAADLRAVIVATDGGFYEAISGQFAKSNATTPVERAAGRLRRLSGSAISAQFDTTFGMPQNNCAIMVVGQITTSIGFDHGALIKVGDASSGYGIGTGDTTFDAGGSNNNLLCLYEAVAWKAPSPAVVLAAAGQSYAACVRINADNTGNIYSPGVGEGSWSASTPVTPAGGVTYVGGYTTNRYPPEEEMLIAFLWARTPTNAEVDSLWRNPNQLFAPRSIWVPVSAGGGAAALEATPAAVATLTGALTTSIRLAASPAAASTLSAGLSTSIVLAAAPSAAAALTGALTTAIQLSAAPAAASTVSAALSTGIPLAAAPASSCTLVAALSTGIDLAAAPTGSATLTGALTTGIALASAPAAVSTLAASLSTSIGLLSAPTSSATLSGSLSTSIQLAAAPASAATLIASLSTTPSGLESAPAAIATLTASLSTAIHLAAAPTGQATLSATLSTSIQLSAAPSSTATMTADLTAAAAGMAAAAIARAQLTATLTTAIRLQAAMAAQATLGATFGNAHVVSPRLYLVPDENRGYLVPDEDRTYSVPDVDSSYSV